MAMFGGRVVTSRVCVSWLKMKRCARGLSWLLWIQSNGAGKIRAYIYPSLECQMPFGTAWNDTHQVLGMKIISKIKADPVTLCIRSRARSSLAARSQLEPRLKLDPVFVECRSFPRIATLRMAPPGPRGRDMYTSKYLLLCTYLGICKVVEMLAKAHE